jgi:hypothetical protein
MARRDGEADALMDWEDWVRFLYLDTRQPFSRSDTNGDTTKIYAMLALDSVKTSTRTVSDIARREQLL